MAMRDRSRSWTKPAWSKTPSRRKEAPILPRLIPALVVAILALGSLASPIYAQAGKEPAKTETKQPDLGSITLPMPSYDRALHALRSYLDSWPGIGRVAVGMHRQGYDPQLTQYDERGWRATFYVTGMEHSLTSDTASAWEPTPWRAVQVAAWDALKIAEHRA
jgi:hypothetical protein